MGYWKDVYQDIHEGLSLNEAVRYNSILRDPNKSDYKKKQAMAKFEALKKINTMI